MKRLLERVLGRPARPEAESQSGETREIDAAAVEACAPGPDGSRTSIIETLRRCVAEGSHGRLRADEIDPEGSLFDRGYLDSFSYVGVMAFIEDTYLVRIDDSQLAGHLSTIAAIADHILRKRSSLAR